MILQIGPNSVVVIVDIIAIAVDISIVIHVGGIITVIAGRPQPLSILSPVVLIPIFV